MLVAFLLLGSLYLGINEAKQATAAQGKPAPALRVETPNSGTITLETLKGQVAMIDFWSITCGPCIKEMPWLVKVAQEYESKGVRFVAVNVDDPEAGFAAVDKFITEDVPALRTYLAFANDETLANYDISFLPTIYIVRRDGMVSANAVGAVTEARVRRWLDEALSAGKPAP